jgi:NYN domain
MARRKKPKSTAIPSIIQQNTLAASPVALLIDGENVIAPDLIAHILVEAGKMGGVVIRQIYGNWVTPSMQPWKEMMTHYALEPRGNIQTNPGRNATDIALVIEAMDLLYRGVRHFCLVAGDSDYVPLVHRLRQDGCVILGIGMPNASQALREACNKFLTIEQLTPHAASSPSKVVSSTSSKPAHSIEGLSTLLTKAYCHDVMKSGDEWILLSALGKALRDLNPHFQETYGKKRLSTIIEQCPALFETRQRKTEKGHIDEVRLRTENH